MVGAISSVREAIDVLAATSVNVVLLDYDLGEEQGFAFFDAMRRANLTARVLVVTAGVTDAATLRAMELGAAGIFLKHAPPAQLIQAIRKVAAGEVWLDSKAVRSLIAGAQVRSDNFGAEPSLTDRERSVLKGVFEGLANKEIASALQISESSVKAALQQLFEKTGVRTRSQLVRIALERHSHDWLA